MAPRLIVTNWKPCPLSPDELTVTFKGRDYNIKVKYGDLLKQEGLKVISFDERFTKKVGSAPEDINPTSICGQYLESNPVSDMQHLIDAAHLKPERKKSEYKNQTKYI